jgi:hypothetical protein
MAGKAIKNFVVGIGYDYDEKGQQKVNSGIDGIRLVSRR